jgi:hypothetical protein
MSPGAAFLVLLLGLVVVLGGIGLYVHARQQAIESLPATAGPAVTAAPAVPATVQPQAVPTQVPVVAPVVAPTTAPTPLPATQVAAAPQPTPVPTVQPTPPPATAQPTSQSQPASGEQQISLAVSGDIDPALVSELEHAYWLYWDRRAQAYASLDPSALESVADQKIVDDTATFIDQLRAEGHSGKTVVQHNAQLLSADEQSALIFDAYTSNSYFVSLDTGQPEEPRPAPESLKVLYRFMSEDGSWKLTGEQRV